MLAAVVGVLLPVFLALSRPLHQPPAALGAAARHLHHQGHGEIALREAWAGQEAPKPSGFHHQIPPAFRAHFRGHFVRHLDAHALQVLLRLFQALVEVPVKVPQNPLPGDAAPLHEVQLLLHMGGELEVGNVGEFVLHQLRHHPAQVGDF